MEFVQRVKATIPSCRLFSFWKCLRNKIAIFVLPLSTSPSVVTRSLKSQNTFVAILLFFTIHVSILFSVKRAKEEQKP
jgi:hypothetical protein